MRSSTGQVFYRDRLEDDGRAVGFEELAKLENIPDPWTLLMRGELL